MGNVVQIVDAASSGETISYTYDHLGRLLSVSAPLNECYYYNEIYAYDEIGNFTIKNGWAVTYGNYAHKHAAVSYNGTSYEYDANGNMTTRGTQTIKYDPENRPVRVKVGGTICRFGYDGDGVRRKRLDANGTIHYLGAYERNVGNGFDTTEVVTKHYTAAFGKLSRLIAFRKGRDLYRLGSDHLGSTIRVADSSFAPVDGMRYLPYDEHWCPVHRGNYPACPCFVSSSIWSALRYCANSLPRSGRFSAYSTVALRKPILLPAS